MRFANCVAAGLLVLTCLAGGVVGRESPRKPNIVIVVADDLGYGELGCQGNKQIPTPNIDALAAAGVRFTNGYVSCPVCSPTRAGLMTGRYQQRFGHEFNPGPTAAAAGDFGLSKKETTIAERLKTFGYTTGMVGKWHLGFTAEYLPTQRGFDSFFGFLGGAHSYVRDRPGTNREILRGDQGVNEKEYLTDAFGREACAFIDKNHDKSFLLYMPFNAVHAPLEASDKYRGRVAGISAQKRQTFAAMLVAMDDAVGKILGKLNEYKLDDNTLVVFFSDNGGPTPQTTSGNGPLRGFKGSVYEGGIRIPFAMRWTGKIPPGKVDDRPVIALDIHPTIVAAAGEKVEPSWNLDGVNLLPYLTGEKTGNPHDSLFWRYGDRHAIRHGNWKLLTNSPGETPSLFNLAEDIGESTDVASKNPEIATKLNDLWKSWNAQLEDPKWERANRKTDRKAAKRKAGKDRI